MHGFIQLFSVVCMLVGFGLGVKLAQDLDIVRLPVAPWFP
jgi:hypothetical protein